MRNYFIAFGIFLSFIFILLAAFILFIFVFQLLNNIIEFFGKKREYKLREQHPDYFAVQELYERGFAEAASFQYNEIDLLKQKVDDILLELRYLPKEQQVSKEKELESLRKTIQKNIAIHKNLVDVYEQDLEKLKELKKNYGIKI